MVDVCFFFVFAPLLIQPMYLACHILEVHKIKSLLHPTLPSQLLASFDLELHMVTYFPHVINQKPLGIVDVSNSFISTHYSPSSNHQYTIEYCIVCEIDNKSKFWTLKSCYIYGFYSKDNLELRFDVYLNKSIVGQSTTIFF
jgi:hypothetical protein